MHASSTPRLRSGVSRRSPALVCLEHEQRAQAHGGRNARAHESEPVGHLTLRPADIHADPRRTLEVAGVSAKIEQAPKAALEALLVTGSVRRKEMQRERGLERYGLPLAPATFFVLRAREVGAAALE